MRILKYFVVFIVFVYTLLAFFPKENLYYYLLKNIEPYEVKIVHKNIDTSSFVLNISDMKFFYDEINIFDAKSVDINTYLLKSKINIEKVVLNEDITNILNIQISNLVLDYSIFDPKKIYINSKYNLGELHGFIDLNNNLIKVKFTLEDSFVLEHKELLKALKKDSIGKYYIYEQRI